MRSRDFGSGAGVALLAMLTLTHFMGPDIIFGIHSGDGGAAKQLQATQPQAKQPQAKQPQAKQQPKND